MNGTKATAHLDPATRILDALDRYDFKKSPIAFNAMYDAIEEHTLRELDNSVAFESSTFPAHLTVDTSEHPLCFAFALAVKIIRFGAPYIPMLVRASQQGDRVHITLEAKTNGIALKSYFERQEEVFEHLAHIARFQTLFELSSNAVRVTFSLSLYDASTFQLHAVCHTSLTEIFSLATTYVDEFYSEK